MEQEDPPTPPSRPGGTKLLLCCRIAPEWGCGSPGRDSDTREGYPSYLGHKAEPGVLDLKKQHNK